VLVKLDNAPLDNIFLMEYGSKNNIDSQDETQFQKLLKDLKGWMGISSNAQNTVQTRNEISECTTATPEEMKICADYIYMVEHRGPIVASALGKTTTIEVTDVTETGKKVEALAKKGITEAEYAIGFGNYNRNRHWSMGGDEKYKKAEYWLEKAAKKGHVKAQATLAEMYYWGKEIEKAIPWALPASKGNNITAAQILAWCYRDKKEKKNYIDAVKTAAEIQKATKDRLIHNPALQYGKALFENGNLEEAIQWFDEAINLAYDSWKKGEAIYHKGKTLYQQGHKLKAMRCLDIVAPDDPYGYSCSELAKKIKSELNPFSKFFKK
jgi:TPR repeat protein